MDDLTTAQNENANMRRIRSRLWKWDATLAAINSQQEEYLNVLNCAWLDDSEIATSTEDRTSIEENYKDAYVLIASLNKLKQLPPSGINSINDFLLWYYRVHSEIYQHVDANYFRYLQQLEMLREECHGMLEQITNSIENLKKLSNEYEFVSQKTSTLNKASEQLIEEQQKLQELGDDIQRRLYYFNQVEFIHQRLQSPTLSVSSEVFHDCLNRIDACLQYICNNPKFKDSSIFVVKYKHCLAKAVTLMKANVSRIMTQATQDILHPKQFGLTSGDVSKSISSQDAAFALYYGKYQPSAIKIKRISQLVETRIHQNPEYEQLLTEMQQIYLTERVTIMSPAVHKAIKDLITTHKGDHCSLMRSACSFLVHICQDEQRLYYQFFAVSSDQLNAYLEGLCIILYDAMRPLIIHINHLETLAEICSILRIEMLEEHVQQNPKALDAFANTADQLLQDVQERLVFRAHLYLQSDISNYNPSAGDLAYPEKFEMMESIALSLQEPSSQIRRSDSRSSLISGTFSAVEAENIDGNLRLKNMNSPADLHGMWYPTVRRTLVCLSRLYRCVDRPIFQSLSQEALKLCISSVSVAAGKISATKTKIDGELFEIKHLLILREQIAPFRVDFTVKETSLDFSKVKTAAFGLLQKRKQLFSMGSNNALLEFLLEGTPQIKEHLLDSRKEVDRQLKTICEQFIKDASQMLVGPVITFLDKANALLTNDLTDKNSMEKDKTNKVNYVLRQSNWASPQQISSIIQETQRLIKTKLSGLQRSMQLYLSNRDTEFIIFRPIRNNIIHSFVKLEQLLTTSGYTTDDMIIASCPSAEQVSILLSSASILAVEDVVNFSAVRKTSTSSNESNYAPSVSNKIGLYKNIALESTVQVMEKFPELSESSNSCISSPIPQSPTQDTQIENASTYDIESVSTI